MVASTRVRIAGIVIILIVGSVFVWYRRDSDPNRLTPAFPTDEVRIAVDASFAPFATIDENGQYVGLDIALGQAISDEVGLPVRFVNMSVDSLYDAVEGHQVDMVISAIQADFWRMDRVFYSRPYFDAGLVLVSAIGVDSMRDLPDKRLAYEFGSAAEAETRLWTRRIQAFEMLPYQLPVYALDAVRLGQAEAALVDAVTARLYLRAHPEWQAEFEYVTHEHYVIAVSIERPNTSDVLDEVLERLFDAGVIDELIDEWL